VAVVRYDSRVYDVLTCGVWHVCVGCVDVRAKKYKMRNEIFPTSNGSTKLIKLHVDNMLHILERF
jgi:hypothetical protein